MALAINIMDGMGLVTKPVMNASQRRQHQTSDTVLAVHIISGSGPRLVHQADRHSTSVVKIMSVCVDYIVKV